MLRARAGYYGNITFIDHQIGRLLYEFQHHDSKAKANTFIIFASDHGDMLGDHFRWRKSVPFQGSLNIPMFLSYPSNWALPRGEAFDQPVELRDIMPTVLDAAGVPIPDSVDGKSLLSLPHKESSH